MANELWDWFQIPEVREAAEACGQEP